MLKVRRLLCFLLWNIAIVCSQLLMAKNASGQANINVVATTSWTAEYVKLAGCRNVDILAPSTLVHPSEYELQVSDLKKLKNAEYIVFAGYEVMIGDLKKVLDQRMTKFVPIKTSYAYDEIEQNVLLLAKVFNTTKEAQINLARLKQVFENSKQKIAKSGYRNEPVAVHFFQQQIANELHLNVVSVFGPTPLEVYDLHELSKSGARYVIDNYHNPVAAPLREILKAKSTSFINFPGSQFTNSIETVIEYNTKVFSEMVK